MISPGAILLPTFTSIKALSVRYSVDCIFNCAIENPGVGCGLKGVISKIDIEFSGSTITSGS